MKVRVLCENTGKPLRQYCHWVVVFQYAGVLCALMASDALAQYRFDNWTTEQGLPQNTVPAITQTRDGYLWVGTYNGLARFDGVRFTAYDKSNNKAFSNSRVSDLYEDAAGALWVGIVEGGVLRYQNGVFTSFTREQGLPNNNTLMGMRSSPGKTPLIFTDAGAVWWRDGGFVPYEVSGTPNEIQMYVGRSGTHWLVDKLGLHARKDGQNTDYTIPVELGSLSSLKFNEDRSGALWLGGERHGVFKVKNGSMTDYSQRLKLSAGAVITRILEDADGSLWFGTINTGLIHFREGEQDEVSVYTMANGLSSNGIVGLFQDRENTLWIGTDGGGLNRMTRRFITSYSAAQGLAGNVVHSVLEDQAGNIWAATQAGLSRITNGVVTNYPSGRAPQNLPLQPQSLQIDHTGRLWIGGWNGLCTFNNGVFSMAIPGLNVHAMLEDRQGNFWIGTHNGLIKYKDGVQTLYQVKDGLPNDIIRVIQEDRNGALWFGTEGGLVKFESGRFTVFTTRNGLANDHVWSIYEDTGGVLWLGTFDAGLMRLKDGRFTSYTMEHGMYNNGVFQILEDERGNLWMSCYRGLYSVRKQQLDDFAAGRVATITSTAFGKADGMLTPDCNGSRQPSGIKSRDGKLWFTTVKGLAVVTPNEATSNPLPPSVQIEEIRIDNKQIDSLVGGGRGIQMLPGQYNLEIHYTGISFMKAEQIRFRYKLIGQDQDWVDAGTRRAVNYSYLPPGGYTFQVLAANSDGVWNDAGASLRIVVVPPFYSTWWFLGLIGLSVAGLVTLIYRLRVAQLRKEHAVKEAFSRQLLESQETFSRRLIESQESERKRIAAELHDGLGQSLVIIKNRALLSLTEPEDHNRAIEQIEEIAEAATHAILETREIAYNLRPFHIDRLGLTSAIGAMVNRAGNNSLRFTMELDSIDGLLMPEQEIGFYRIVQESLNNIIKHSEASEASVVVKWHGRYGTLIDQRIELTIQDNGKGFSPGAQVDPNQRGGFGLLGLNERARILGGTLTITSAPHRGTTIHLQLPLSTPTRKAP